MKADLIDRQAAIDALGEEPPVWYDGEDEIAERNQWRRDVKAIKSVPSVQPEPYRAKREPMAKTEISIPNATPTTVTNSWTIARHWIPCNWHTEKENLPKECLSVLICIKDNSGYHMAVSYRTDYNRWEGYGRANVIAWMPLPEAYREDSECYDE